MQEILLGHGTWFSAQLLRLIAKSDHENLQIIRSVYADHVEAYETWLATGREEPYFTDQPVPEERGHNPEAYA
jgi:hypothetical protein